MSDAERICTRCVMTDKGDPNIRFDENGVCHYCQDAFNRMERLYFPNEKGKEKLDSLIDALKNKNKNKKYDCLMGISGGLDSCYLAYLGAAKWGLRILAVHIDDGYDTEICAENVKRLCEKAKIDLHTMKPDKKQFNELTRAYLLAGVPNLAIPQDNALWASIYDFAVKEHISDFLSGVNFSLENILQTGNTWYYMDLVNIRDINRRFGRDKFDRLNLKSDWQRRMTRLRLKVQEYTPLNFIDYNRERALKELNEFCGFQYYGSKHLENYLTGFLQLYYLPKKFNVDKRTSHLSSMIISGQMTRDQALEELKKPPVEPEWLEKAIRMIKENMDLSDEEFDRIMDAPPHQHDEYRTDRLLRFCIDLSKKIHKETW